MEESRGCQRKEEKGQSVQGDGTNHVRGYGGEVVGREKGEGTP